MNATVCPSLSTNSDITGIGNRLSIYISAYLGYLMTAVDGDVESFRNAARTSLVTSSALVVAGISSIYNSEIGLTLVDAQVVTMLVAIVATYCYTAKSSGKVRDRKGDLVEPKLALGFTTNLARFLHGVLSSVFGILVYYNVNNFGGNMFTAEECNETQTFVVFFASISATNYGLRIFALLVFSMGLYEVVYAAWKNRGNGVLWIYTKATGQRAGKSGPPPGNRVQAVGLLVLIYLIANTELIIARNGLQSQANVWTLGQTLAMLMLLDQILKAFSQLRKKNIREWATREFYRLTVGTIPLTQPTTQSLETP